MGRDPLKIYAYMSTSGADHVAPCKIEYNEDWISSPENTEVGSISCPTGLVLPLHRKQDHFELQDTEGESILEFDPRQTSQIALYKEKSEIKAKKFPMTNDVKKFYENLPERGKYAGAVIEWGAGFYSGNGAALKGLPNQSEIAYKDESGISVYLAPHWPQSGTGFWFTPLHLKLSFEYLLGSAETDDRGNWNFDRQKIALWFGPQLDSSWLKQLFTGHWNASEEVPFFNFNISYLTPAIGKEWMSQGTPPLAYPDDETSFSALLYPGQQHRIEAAAQFQITDRFRLGILGFFVPSEGIADGKYSDEFNPYGILLTLSGGAYTSSDPVEITQAELPTVRRKPLPPPPPTPVVTRPISEDQKIAKMALDNYHLLDNYPLLDQAAIWLALRELMREEGLDFPEAMVTDYATFLREAAKLTQQPNQARSILTLWEFWKNRPAPPKDVRPVALLIYSAVDGNGAYDRPYVNDPFGQSKKFRVFYRPAKSEAEFHDIIARVHAEAGARIHTLIINGHGDEKRLVLGAAEPGKAAETADLDIEDFRQKDFVHFAEHLDPKGQMVLQGCSMGKGGKTGKNLTNAFTKILPPTFQIYSTGGTTGMPNIHIGDDLKLKVDWTDGPAYNPRGQRGVWKPKPIHRRIEVE